jgi:acetyltransferase-like isoleucine patch superfamily enzyme
MVTYSIGGSLDIKKPYLLTGESEQRTDLELPTLQENIDFLAPYVAEAQAGGTISSYTIPAGTIDTFGPKYINGNLKIGKNCVITLEGTIYVTGDIDIDKDATITGNGSIIAEGNISMAKVADYGTDGTSIIMSLYGDIEFKKDANLAALIYAPNGSVKFSTDVNGAEITGSIVCASIESDVDLDHGIKVVYDPNVYHNLDLPGSSRIQSEFLSWIID